MTYSLHLCYGSIPDWHWFSMVTGDTILKVAASLSKFAVRTGSAAPEETKTAQEATGVHIDFEMLAETSYEETLNLRMASQDSPDIFSQSVASYQQKLEKAIDEDILIGFEVSGRL